MHKEEVKLSLFAYDMILYTQKTLTNLYTHTHKTVRGKKQVQQGYKSNMQKSLVLLYNRHEKSESEIKKTISFIIASKRILINNVNKRSQNYKTSLKGIKKT